MSTDITRIFFSFWCCYF